MEEMRDQQTWLIHSCPVSQLVWCHCYSHSCGCIRMDPGMFRRGSISRCCLYPDNSSTIQIPPCVFLLMEIEYWHLDLSSNERRMVVSQDHPRDLWRRIPFLGVKKVRVMLQRSSCNQPSCFGLRNSLRDRSCLNMTTTFLKLKAASTSVVGTLGYPLWT